MCISYRGFWRRRWWW